MSKIQNAVIGSVRTVIGWVPAGWLPGGAPDPLIERRAAIGSQASRLDGPLKVAGQARFAAEVVMERLCHAALVHSTVTRGRLARMDTQAAEAAPGVIMVVTYRNMPRVGPLPLMGMADLSAVGNSSLPILQDAQVRYNGQVVAAVIAETQDQADHAASLIQVDYEREPARTVFEEAKAHARTPASVLIEKNHVSVGNAERELISAPHSVDNVYRTPGQNHNAIELHTVTAAWEGESLVVHDTTQMVAPSASALAKLFGLKKEQVRVLSPFVGGGFGGKGLWDHQIVAVAVARMIGRPLRVTLSREGVYRIIGGRSPSEQRVAISADAAGKFSALVHTGYSVMPPYGACPEQYTMGSRALYDAGSFEIVQRHVDLDIVPNTFMRAPGEAIGTFALESAIDELAHGMGMDPIELRLHNIAERHPLSGTPFSQHALKQAFDDGARRFGWERRRTTPATRREGEWRIGMGCATGSFPYVRMPGANVSITLRSDGTATIACSAQEMGMGTATVQAQHAADRLGLPIEAITFELGDSALPAAPMAGGSSQTVSIAGAIAAGAEKLTLELLRLAGNASPVAGLRPSEVRLTAGGIASTSDPARNESYRSILARAARDAVTITAAGSAPLEMFKFAMHSSSAVFCELRVSDVTGEVRVDRLLGSFDCGTILNPKTAASQFRGGMIMGLGLALMEETLFDERSGRIMNATLADYHIPAHLDVPQIDVMWTGIPDPRSPLGARGIGEIGVTGVAAAVANAVFNATGKRVRDLPITLDKLLTE
ncbi:xanthine dehydrogenase family protein molybdopterin-binding subunit [Novosphingobium sp. AP12]|uniref:xanthine dehydrogenase family protein molybdopterin-binding subunit n=1 Tax=Novosphingobium sp. AP12 TaxID=1144305 RepID=UPI000271DD29|nr:xanthine dehydrogenase family protein molybdopterin-binding subunit [Novosphingobium sp. AP12]EJL33479.1 aerobic-type carbon monoxide dehydrogenase, large subunit CoxL/CutL-like protein [Novosphingobium sp. AP12]